MRWRRRWRSRRRRGEHTVVGRTERVGAEHTEGGREHNCRISGGSGRSGPAAASEARQGVGRRETGAGASVSGARRLLTRRTSTRALLANRPT